MENIKYEIRNEIEKIIKEQKIDRQQFHEVSKFKYEDVIQKLYYSFFNNIPKYSSGICGCGFAIV